MQTDYVAIGKDT